MRLDASILGIGVTGPGLTDWPTARAVLRGEQPWQAADLQLPAPQCLPANERRRTTPLIRLAIGVAEQACRQAELAPAELASVFASAEGDTPIVDRLCTALTQPGKPVSPTQFHNSVHNAPVGYWAIATGARLPSTSISAGSASFAAGLMDALSYLHTTRSPVLLVGYDVPLPETLVPFGTVHQPFGVALVLAPGGSGLARVRCSGIGSMVVEDDCGELETLRWANPAAQALPLLRALARGDRGEVALRYLDNAVLHLEVTPC